MRKKGDVFVKVQHISSAWENHITKFNGAEKNRTKTKVAKSKTNNKNHIRQTGGFHFNPDFETAILVDLQDFGSFLPGDSVCSQVSK
jgi:hypothetical protein